MQTEVVRDERQARLNERVSALRTRAAALDVQADRRDGAVPMDRAWAGPSFGGPNARQRDRHRGSLLEACRLRSEAVELRRKADDAERSVVRVAGDADAERADKIAACDVRVGDTVSSIYGFRRVVKVNAKSVGLESSVGPLTVSKSLVKLVSRAS